MSIPCVLIFAKYPTPGRVKTRMVPPLTDEQAADLHLASLLAVCENVRRAGLSDVKVVATPDDRVDDFRRLFGTVIGGVWPQGDGNLGDRLVRAVRRAFEESAGPVILLGADSPTLPTTTLASAVASLEDSEVAIGPCADGGYYLLALRREAPELFEAIDWGSAHVYRQTLAAAESAGIDVHQLPTWYDLDRFDDVVRAARDLATIDAVAQPAGDALRGTIRELVAE